NPVITRQNIFLDNSDPASPWDFNAVQNIETLVGQLNYFYSNGLRIKDLVNNSNSSISSFLVLKQALTAPALIADKDIDFANTSFSLKLNTKDGEQSIELKNDLFQDTAGLASFLATARQSLPADFEAIKKQFTNPHNTDAGLVVTPPYELVEVELAVANSAVGGNALVDFRYVEIPAKIREKFDRDKKCVLTLFRTNLDKLLPVPVPVPCSICTNVTVKVKPIRVDNKITALELSPSFIGDLYAMTRLHGNTPELVHSITPFLKGEAGNLLSMLKDGTTIIKTNLSGKTHPPVILGGRANLLPPQDDNVNFADITGDTLNFIRLLWEGMTTNNGGFYLLNRNEHAFDNFPAGQKEYSLLLSFEPTAAGDTKPQFGFNTHFRIENNNNLFDALDKGAVYLSARVFLPAPDAAGNYTLAAKEYQSKMPAHCLGFEIERNGNPADFLQYIPLDLELLDTTQNRKLIDRDDFFPLMPKNKQDAKGDALPGNVYYNHITPLLMVDPASQDPGTRNLVNRYSAVGKEFQLNFSLRDSYGFRTTSLPVSIKYKHRYSDKLIPLSAWPFIKCSYQCQDAGADIHWQLKIAFDKEGGDALINGDNGDKKNSILGSLWTVRAQLLDTNVKIILGNKDIDTGVDILQVPLDRNELDKLIAAAMSFVAGGADANAAYLVPFVFKGDTLTLKTLLAPCVTITRSVADGFTGLPPGVKEENVWEYDNIRSSTTAIPLAGSFDKANKKAGNGIKELDAQLADT
ncbi:MAG TPA: hypothetical protein VLD19_07775, partial [Chitinophagaceae bacterium]|nr:hypothetical protein [Chitinophagaceae bacterium]